jgi:hypothetical protein
MALKGIDSSYTFRALRWGIKPELRATRMKDNTRLQKVEKGIAEAAMGPVAGVGSQLWIVGAIADGAKALKNKVNDLVIRWLNPTHF